MLTPELLWGLGLLVLVGALVWGIARHRRRNRANDAVTEAATRAEYDRPDTYQTEEARYRDRVRPS